jgi:hypothetical protein
MKIVGALHAGYRACFENSLKYIWNDVYNGCRFALSFNGTHTTKAYLLITTRTDEISDIHMSVIRIEVIEEREFSEIELVLTYTTAVKGN